MSLLIKKVQSEGISDGYKFTFEFNAETEPDLGIMSGIISHHLEAYSVECYFAFDDGFIGRDIIAILTYADGKVKLSIK